MANNDAEIEHLYKVHKTVIEMLSDRRYIIEQRVKDMTLEDFKNQHGEQEHIRTSVVKMYQHQDFIDEQIYVFFLEPSKVGAKEIKECYTKMKASNVTRCIMVYSQAITPHARSCIETLRPIIMEQFKESELLVNITKHRLVPKHVLLSKEEQESLLTRYKLQETQLPRIQSVDPVARYYGLQKGQIIKILRSSETAGRYITYRLVM
mmetsp:Transcript_4701/g.5105  ORF Transcript_4701/g.5105 Transcript_4701/m.5105 type:complete len:207 (+) Transcript_4701:44-664(+)